LKDTHLGELIFGHDEWMHYGMKPRKPNALAQMFAYEGKCTLVSSDAVLPD
jgi:hypothetical protein